MSPLPDLAPYLEKWNLPQSISSHTLAYLAGFFDGEGCIQLVKPPPKKMAVNPVAGICLSISLTNTDQPPLDLAIQYFGGTTYGKVMSEHGNVPARCWRVGGKRAANFLFNVEPYLIVKKEQARWALLFAETYFAQWHHVDRKGSPLTKEAIHLRRFAFTGFRREMDSKLGRGITWSLPSVA